MDVTMGLVGVLVWVSSESFSCAVWGEDQTNRTHLRADWKMSHRTVVFEGRPQVQVTSCQKLTMLESWGARSCSRWLLCGNWEKSMLGFDILACLL